ncbi:MAG: hypothetical protein AB7T49_15440 [Oligoflexales bacterium]
MTNPIKKIAEEVMNKPKPEKVTREKHTIYVSARRYKRFMDHCKDHGKTPSEVVDMLIESYLTEAETITKKSS